MADVPARGSSTIAAVLVGVVTVFADFAVDTIVWTVFAIAYQQFGNHVMQPQIQRRTVSLEPIVILVSVLLGGTLFGLLGAILAIPVAATLKVTLEEWRTDRAGLAPAVDASPSG